MIFTAGNILLIGSILLFVSIIVGKTGYRFGVPALLLFLVVGMLFGSDGQGQCQIALRRKQVDIKPADADNHRHNQTDNNSYHKHDY